MGLVGIYCIENKDDGKKYIGRAVNINDRFKCHKNSLIKNTHDNKYLQNVWNKHGENIFNFYIVEECKENELNEKEKHYIKELNTKRPNGYNLTDGGEGSTGYIPSDEIKEKLSKAHKGSKNSFFGKTHTVENREKISKANKGKLSGDKNPMFGKTHSEDAKKKISDAHKGKMGRQHSKETKEKISKNNLGKVFSEETRKKMSESSLGKQKNKRNTSSKYYGVNRYKGGWRARFICNKVEYNLGIFKNEIDAAKAVDIKNLEIRGKNAKLNFPN